MGRPPPEDAVETPLKWGAAWRHIIMTKIDASSAPTHYQAKTTNSKKAKAFGFVIFLRAALLCFTAYLRQAYATYLPCFDSFNKLSRISSSALTFPLWCPPSEPPLIPGWPSRTKN